MKSFTSLAAIACVVAADAEQTCRALVLSGGANNGAWEAGVLWGLANYGNESDFYYDIMTGVSAGAINTAGTAGFAPNDVKNAAQFLSDTWASLTTDQIWQLWEGKGFVNGCHTEYGCFDDSPALEFIRETLAKFPDGFKRRVTVASANVETGEYETFTQDNVAWADYHQAALASGSIPGVFPPQHFKDMVLMDGGTIWDVNIDSAIQQCNDMGVTDPANIIVDIAICGNVVAAPSEVHKDAVGNLLDSYLIKKSYEGMNSIQWQMRSNPNVNYRYLFYEEYATGYLDCLGFNNSTTWPLQEQGRQDAQEMLKLGEGKGFHALDLWMDDEPAMEKKWGSFMNFVRSFMPAGIDQ